MTFKYDETVDALYIRFSDGIVDRTLELDSGTMVDVDNHGILLGVEIIRPARNWPLDDLLSGYAISDDDVAVLRKMFAQGGVYPYTAERTLVPA